jgi:hypothetical protein
MNMRELLRRFRPAGMPGAAAPAAVPDDPARRGAAELQPLFDALAAVRTEAADIRATAERAAAERERHAAAEAARITAEATAAARTAPQAAFGTAQADIRHTGTAIVAAARAEANAIRDHDPDRLERAAGIVAAEALRAADADPSSLGMTR